MEDPALLTELLEETIDVAIEDGMTNDANTFITFILDMLPPDILEALQEVTGGGDSFIEDIFEEKFAVVEEEYEEQYDDRCCALCDREMKVTRHHLIPKETHSKMLKKGYKESLLMKTAPVCRFCHSTIHRFFTNDELADHYNTIEKLLEDERVFKFARWASKLAPSQSKMVR
jgi:hypothetical protein